MKAMEKAGLVKLVGKKNFCSHIDTALLRAEEIERKIRHA
jgi:SulP family sulfate permease